MRLMLGNAQDHPSLLVNVKQEHQEEEHRQTGIADFKYYIGVGWGQDEAEDKSYIAEHGSTFDRAAGNLMFGVKE